jgi:hypothetical protein
MALVTSFWPLHSDRAHKGHISGLLLSGDRGKILGLESMALGNIRNRCSNNLALWIMCVCIDGADHELAFLKAWALSSCGRFVLVG